MMRIHLKIALLCLFLVGSFVLPVFAGGPDGFMGITWDEIKQVKAKVVECRISAADKDAFVPETYATYDEKGRIVEYDEGYSLSKYMYNNWGIVEIVYGGWDEVGDFMVWGKTIYTYDTKGKLKKIAYQDGEGADYMAETGITYDKNNNIKIERLTPESSVYQVDTLNPNFNLLESIVFTGDSVAMGAAKTVIESKTTYKYDNDNNLIEKLIEYFTVPFEGMPEKITQTFKYEFDKKGNKTSQKTTVVPKNAVDFLMDLARPQLNFTYAYPGEPSLKPVKEPPMGPDGDRPIVQVEYDGEWYPAVILEQDGDQYLIHYVDYDESYDEWVTEDRIDFEN